MTHPLVLFAVGIALGCGAGYAVATNAVPNMAKNDHVNSYGEHAHAVSQEHAHGSHDYGAVLQIPVEHAPTVKVEAFRDPGAGWNLHVSTTSFTFAPLNASTEHVLGEGHAHIYVNGEKLGRLYGNWYHLPQLPNGMSEVKVGLFSNDHKVLAVGEEVVEHSIMIESKL